MTASCLDSPIGLKLVFVVVDVVIFLEVAQHSGKTLHGKMGIQKPEFCSWLCL